MPKLIGIFVTHEVPSSVLSSILTTAYDEGKKVDCDPTLVLLESDTKESLHRYTLDSFTRPPVDSSFKSPFLGWDANQVAQFLLQNAKGSVVSCLLFALADEKTSEDENTLQLVEIAKRGGGSDEFDLESIRVSAEFLNSEAVSISMATSGMNELVAMADSDGVYRGGSDGIPRDPPKKGGPAPRKQLAGHGM